MLFQKELPRIFQASEVSFCKAFKDEAVVRLLQVFNNATNGCLRERPKGEIFSAFLYYPMGYKLPPPNFLYFMSNVFIVIHLLILDDKISWSIRVECFDLFKGRFDKVMCNRSLSDKVHDGKKEERFVRRAVWGIGRIPITIFIRSQIWQFVNVIFEHHFNLSRMKIYDV